METEHDNLHAALEWSLSAEPAIALRLAGALGRFWNVYNYFAGGREMLGRALEGGSAAPKAWQAKGQRWLGSLAERQGNTEWAIRLETDSLETASGLMEKAEGRKRPPEKPLQTAPTDNSSRKMN